MKGNISRQSHRPENRYSGVFQVQGGMVTDADLGEQAAIARMRVDALGHDAVCGGVPAKDGAVSIGEGDLPGLTEGTIYAEGVRGETVASDAFEGAMGYYDVQVDFPLAPAVGEVEQQIVYVDIWERMVSLLEEPDLADAGLHGVETAFRSRTMTQIKLAPASEAEAIANGAGRFPRIGTGQLSVTPVDPETIFDECDPCADIVSAEQTVANALFRIEVLQVAGNANAPTSVTIGWSAENASAIAPSDVNPEDFERAGAVYEFFSPVTESHLGVHANSGDVQVSSFAVNLADGPTDPTAPEGGDWPFVRRWDGIVEVDTATEVVTRVGGGTLPVMDTSVFTLTVDAFTATLDFTGATVVAGDYWLVEMRRFSEDPIRAVQPGPIGILHNYCPLFRLEDGEPQPLTDAEHRKLSFPFLADLPATHIGFDNNCTKLYEDAENLQEALDNLCNIDASDIAFDPSDCRRLYDNTDNVQDALINLCRVDFGNERLLRLLHDWGVVCGVLLRRSPNNTGAVNVSSGSILDRAGRLGDLDAMQIDLNELAGSEFFHFDSLDSFANEFAEGGVCLALAIDEGGEIRPHVLPKNLAFEPQDPTFLTVLRDCVEERPVFVPADDFTTRPAAEQATLNKVFYGAANQQLASGQRLNGAEFAVAERYNDNLIEEYRAHIQDEEEFALLQARLDEVDEELQVNQATGAVRETRRLQREAARYRLVQESNQERYQRCICDALFPRCPELGEPPHFVPIGCVEGRVGNGRIVIRQVCPYECRKQVMSWRMMQYFITEMRANFSRRLAEACCRPPRQPGGPLTHLDLPLAQAIPPEAAAQPNFFFDRAERSFDILTGNQPANEYQVKPDVGNLATDQAELVLKGNGIEVAEAIELSDTEAVAKLREKSVGIEAQDLLFDQGKLKPGDRVALITQDGVAVDYIKLEEGPGKFIFEAREIATPGTGGTFDPGATRPRDGVEVIFDQERLTEAENATRALEERITLVREEARTAENDLLAATRQRTALADEIAASSRTLDDLESRRIDLERQVTAASRELETARTERLELAREVDVTATRLEDMRAERQTLATDMEAARGELRTLTAEQERVLASSKTERDELVRSMRRNAPVSAVVKNNDALTKSLAERGITTQGAFAELPDAELRRIATESRTNVRTVTSLRNAADKQIKAKIE
ncbi:MAG: DUF6519 domain-containing protein [Pseudomonadota bacterium]